MRNQIGIFITHKPSNIAKINWCAQDGDKLISLRTRVHLLSELEHAYPDSIAAKMGIFEFGHLVRLKPKPPSIKCPKCKKRIQLSFLDLPGAFEPGGAV